MRGSLRVIASGIVVVRQDDDFAVFQELAVIIAPLARALWIGRCHKAKLTQPVSIFLAFAYKDRRRRMRRK